MFMPENKCVSLVILLVEETTKLILNHIMKIKKMIIRIVPKHRFCA